MRKSRLEAAGFALLFVGLLSFSLFLRVWGSQFGLPAYTRYHPDEHALVERAAAILCPTVANIETGRTHPAPRRATPPQDAAGFEASHTPVAVAPAEPGRCAQRQSGDPPHQSRARRCCPKAETATRPGTARAGNFRSAPQLQRLPPRHRQAAVRLALLLISLRQPAANQIPETIIGYFLGHACPV